MQDTDDEEEEDDADASDASNIIDDDVRAVVAARVRRCFWICATVPAQMCEHRPHYHAAPGRIERVLTPTALHLTPSQAAAAEEEERTKKKKRKRDKVKEEEKEVDEEDYDLLVENLGKDAKKLRKPKVQCF